MVEIGFFPMTIFPVILCDTGDLLPHIGQSPLGLRAGAKLIGQFGAALQTDLEAKPLTRHGEDPFMVLLTGVTVHKLRGHRDFLCYRSGKTAGDDVQMTAVKHLERHRL